MLQSHCAESTAEWSFLVIPGHSSNGNDNDNRFEQCSSLACGLGRPVRSFEHVQRFCVPSENNFHSCLCALRTCSYRVCRTAYMLYSSHSHYILRHSYMHLIFHKKTVRNSMYGAQICFRLIIYLPFYLTCFFLGLQF